MIRFLLELIRLVFRFLIKDTCHSERSEESRPNTGGVWPGARSFGRLHLPQDDMSYYFGNALLVNRLGGLFRQRNSGAKTHLEVERKFPISQTEYEALPGKLETMGFVSSGDVVMTDTFLPVETEGEMIRVRQEEEGGLTRYVLTCKSWVETGGGKERREVEDRLSPFSKTVLLFVARLLNGRPLSWFSKRRKLYTGNFESMEAVAALDCVEGLGQFSGFYLEVEILVPLGEDVTRAREEVLELSRNLLGQARQPAMSYLDMLKKSKGMHVSL